MSDHLGDELRRTLHEPTHGRTDDDAFLRRVHTGAARRRLRRRITVVVAAAGVATVALAVPLGLRDGGSVPSEDPVASQSPTEESEPAPEPGTPVEPTDVQVTAVSGVSESQFWVLGRGSCPSGDCAVVGRAEVGAEPEFVVAPGAPDRATTLRMADGGTDGWVVSDETLYATHDGARTWDEITVNTVPAPQVVTVFGGEVWVSGDNESGRTAAAAAPIDSDTFGRTDLAAQLTGQGALNQPAATRTVAGTVYGFMRDRGVPAFTGTTDGEFFASSLTQCQDTSSLSGSDGALWAVCTTDSGFRPMVSDDGGRNWDVLEVDIGPEPLIGAIDGDRAAVSNGIELYVLNDGRLDIATSPDEGDSSRRYTYLGFTSTEVGYLIDDEGQLSRTDNSGASWEPVELP